jgi:hypothetical protein
MKTFRIRNRITGEWWEGTSDAAYKFEACTKAGWKPEDCEVKEKSDNGGGGWKKVKETA